MAARFWPASLKFDTCSLEPVSFYPVVTALNVEGGAPRSEWAFWSLHKHTQVWCSQCVCGYHGFQTVIRLWSIETPQHCSRFHHGDLPPAAVQRLRVARRHEGRQVETEASHTQEGFFQFFYWMEWNVYINERPCSTWTKKNVEFICKEKRNNLWDAQRGEAWLRPPPGPPSRIPPQPVQLRFTPTGTGSSFSDRFGLKLWFSST